MACAGWCGKCCADCKKPCALDASMTCSPDCPLLGLDGLPINPAECRRNGCNALYYET